MFWTRVLSAVFLSFLVIVIVQSGPWVFFVTVSIVVVLSAFEFSRLAKATSGLIPKLLNIVMAWLFCLATFRPNWININLVLSLAIGLPFLIEIIRREPDSALSNVSFFLLGSLYAGWLCGRHLLLLQQMPNGKNLIFFLVGVTWIGDIAAYLIGKRLGKHKIIPAISPGKSLEGYIAGTIFACIAALTLRHYLLKDMALAHAIILGIGLTIVGQIGDLAESLMKRGAKVKDSGAIIPGHGGILDRCDSLIFIAPALYYYVSLLVY